MPMLKTIKVIVRLLIAELSRPLALDRRLRLDARVWGDDQNA
jgi:hypothetical protein